MQHHKNHRTAESVSWSLTPLFSTNMAISLRDERSRVDSYPYPVKEGQRYINPNLAAFCSADTQTRKGSIQEAH